MKVFISYSRTDKEFAGKLVDSLTSLGHDVWIDVEDISAGTSWSDAIQQALDTCEALLVIVTPISMASKNVADEWQYFLNDSRLVIPLMLKDSPLPYRLSPLQFIDFRAAAYDKSLEQLHKALTISNAAINSPNPQAQPSAPPPHDLSTPTSPSTPPATTPASNYKKLLDIIVGLQMLVGAILALIQALGQLVDYKYLSLAIVLTAVTSAFLRFRLPITFKVATEPTLPIAPLDHLKGLFRPDAGNYILSLSRRRIEFGALASALTIFIFLVFFTTYQIICAPIPCFGLRGAPRILVANFDSSDPTQTPNRLYNELVDSLGNRAEICRVEQSAAIRPEAHKLGKKHNAVVVVWGIERRAYVLAIPDDLASPNTVKTATATALESVSVGLSPDVTDEQITFLTEFAVSQWYEIIGESEQARSILEPALQDARRIWPEDQQGALIEPYFALGYLYDFLAENTRDNRSALRYYTEALTIAPETEYEHYPIIYLNRADIHLRLGNCAGAFEDTSYIIDSYPDFSFIGAAYGTRAGCQPNRAASEEDFEQAIQSDYPLDAYVLRGLTYLFEWNEPQLAAADFQEAIKLAPKEGLYYHFLGMAQLFSADDAAALTTYTKGVCYITAEDRLSYAAELEELLGAFIDIEEILRLLESEPQC